MRKFALAVIAAFAIVVLGADASVADTSWGH